MSIFRREEDSKKYSSVVAPPGMLFVGNPAYGAWMSDDSGQKVWSFYRIYRHLVKLFGWGSYRPTYGFYMKAMAHLEKNISFYGPEHEFGTSGALTKKNFPDYFEKKVDQREDIKHFIKKMFEPKFSSRHFIR
jgi:hypothetical protein